MEQENIQNLPELLSGYFGKPPNILKQTIKRLTEDGDHYGSLMYKLDIDIEDEDTSVETFHTVAKKVPKDPMLQEAFDIQITFKKEVAFYETIIPTLQNFQREEGITNVIDCFPQFYGARFGLTEKCDKVDVDHAVLLMENLIERGYSNIDKQGGFNLNEAEIVLRDLAKFHGVALALKMKHPDIFERKVKIYFHDYHPQASILKIFNPVIIDILKEDKKCAELLPKITIWGTKPFTPPREPFASISHGDMWSSNTMQLCKDDKILKNAFIDFQFYTYRSVVADILFFIWTSVQDYVIAEHLDRLLKYYHFHLLQNLKECNCPKNAFGYENFLQEVKIEADYEIGHALQFIICVINVKKGTTSQPLTKEIVAERVTQRAKERTWFIIKECEKRGWL